MDVNTLLAQSTELLQRQGRVSYGALKRRFTRDDDCLQDLKGGLIGAQQLAVDEDGKILVWTGSAPVPSSKSQALSSTQPPALQTPNSEYQAAQSLVSQHSGLSILPPSGGSSA